MYLIHLVLVAFSALIVSATVPTRTVSARDNIIPRSSFVSTDSAGNFMVNGSRFTFIGTNAYWLPTLNTAEDIDFTLGNMSANGIKVVRVWGFNDVETIPENGTWFQLIANGTTTINNDTNGLQKLDTVIDMAEKHNMFVILSLTNNWNPRPLLDNITASLLNFTASNSTGLEIRDVTPGTNNSLPRNTLSNDYGGMDVYVREFTNGSKQHDEFYTNETIQMHFTNYVTTVVSRYVNRTSLFSWEVANDPRCNSSLPTSPSCNTITITQFHANVSAHIKSIDTNHLVSSGNQGFFCTDCQKLFFKNPAPAPQISAAPTAKRRAAKPMTRKRLLMERKAAEKNIIKRRSAPSPDGVKIRGKWVSAATKRQNAADEGVGSAFDGSQGVDSEDISAIPDITFSTFQLFPDQDDLGFISDPTLPAFNNTVNAGISWINRHADVGVFVGKPVVLIAFGLVTQNNAPVFVPFNTSVAPFGPDSGSDQATQPFGVTDQQRDDAYSQWINAGIQNQLQGIMQYQWTQGNLTTSPGTDISATPPGTGISPTVTGTGLSPNDGYGLQGVGESQAQGVIQEASQAIAPDS